MPSADLDGKEREVTELGNKMGGTSLCHHGGLANTWGHKGQCVNAEQAMKQEHQTSDEGGRRINPCKFLFVQ